MKTLDEVIEAERHCIGKGCQGCPYDIATYGGSCDCSDDALHYLKEYKDKEAMYDSAFKIMEQARKQYHESVSQYVSAHANLYAEEPNDPLTWDELKQMEGKPVWVELTYPEGRYSHWGIIEGFPKAGYEFMTLRGFHQIDSFSLMAKEKGKTWQAYRKERKMYPKFIELHKDKKLYSINVDNVVAFGDGHVKTVDMDGHYTHVGESYAEIKQLIEDVGCLVHKADPRLDTEHPLTMDDLMTMEGEPVWNSNMCVWMLVKSVDELYATMMWASGNVSEYTADDLERYPVYRMRR